MNKKNIWILVISIVVVLALAAVLLVVMLGDVLPEAKPNENGQNTTQGGEVNITDDPTTASGDPVDTTAPVESDPTGTTAPATTAPATTAPEETVDVDIDPDDDDDGAVEGGTIDFDDLLGLT